MTINRVRVRPLALAIGAVLAVTGVVRGAGRADRTAPADAVSAETGLVEAAADTLQHSGGVYPSASAGGNVAARVGDDGVRRGREYGR